MSYDPIDGVPHPKPGELSVREKSVEFDDRPGVYVTKMGVRALHLPALERNRFNRERQTTETNNSTQPDTVEGTTEQNG